MDSKSNHAFNLLNILLSITQPKDMKEFYHKYENIILTPAFKKVIADAINRNQNLILATRLLNLYDIINLINNETVHHPVLILLQSVLHQASNSLPLSDTVEEKIINPIIYDIYLFIDVLLAVFPTKRYEIGRFIYDISKKSNEVELAGQITLDFALMTQELKGERFSEAVLREALARFDENAWEVQSILRNGLARILLEMDEKHTALEEFVTCLEIFKQHDDKSGQVIVLQEIADVYSAISKPAIAIEYRKQAIELLSIQQDFEATIPIVAQLALDYEQLGELDNAKQQVQFIIDHADAYRNEDLKVEALKLLARLLEDEGDTGAAVKTFQYITNILKNGDETELNMALGQIQRLEASRTLDIFFDLAKQVKIGQISLEETRNKIIAPEILNTINEDKVTLLYLFLSQTAGRIDNEFRYILAVLNVAVAKNKPVDEVLKIRCVIQLANFIKDMGSYRLAYSMYSSVLLSDRIHEDDFSFGRALMNTAHISIILGEKDDEALRQLEEASKVFEKLGDRYNQIKCINRLGQFYTHHKDYEQALELYENAISTLQEDEEPFLKAMLLGNLSVTHLILNDLEKARQSCVEAMSLFKEQNASRDWDVSSARLFYIEKMGTASAEEREKMRNSFEQNVLNQSVTTAHPGENQPIIYHQAMQLLEQGHRAVATEMLLDVIAYSEVVGYNLIGVLALADVIQIRILDGKVNDARQMLQRFEEILKAKPPFVERDIKGLSVLLYHFRGIYHSHMNEPQKAAEAYLRGLELIQNGDEKEKTDKEELSFLGNLEHEYRILGKVDASRELLERGLAIAREVENEHEIGLYLLQLSGYYEEIEDRDKALEYAEQAQEVLSGLSDQRYMGSALLQEADLFAFKEKAEEASNYYKRALQIAETSDLLELKQSAVFGLARIEQSTGNYRGAYNLFNQSVELIDEIVKLTPQGDSRMSFLNRSSYFTVFDEAIDCAVKNAEFHKAFEHSEAFRARTLADQLRSVDVAPKNIPEDLRKRYESIAQDATIDEAILQLNTSYETDESLLEKHIIFSHRSKPRKPISSRPDMFAPKHISRKRQDLLKEIEKYDPGFEEVSETESINVEEVVKRLKPKQAVIEFFVGWNTTKAFIISEQIGIQVVEIPAFNMTSLGDFLVGTEEEQGWVVSQLLYRFDTDNPSAKFNWKKKLNSGNIALYDKIFSPISEYLTRLEIDHLVLVPHRGMTVLPLHSAAKQSDNSIRYLLDDYVISYAPSCRILHRCISRLDRVQNVRTLMAYANPTGDLKFAETEVRKISSLFSESKLLIGKDCTRKSFLDSPPKETYIHFAGHANYDILNPLQSVLLFGREEPEQLTLADVFQYLRIPATRLLVLSACESGISDTRNMASEYIGFTSGFLHAGVPGILSSLWTVDDQSTALLMDSFYTNHLKRKLEPAAALREAQTWLRTASSEEIGQKMASGSRLTKLDYSKIMSHLLDAPSGHDTPFSSPYYWAPFTFYGA